MSQKVPTLKTIAGIVAEKSPFDLPMDHTERLPEGSNVLFDFVIKSLALHNPASEEDALKFLECTKGPLADQIIRRAKAWRTLNT